MAKLLIAEDEDRMRRLLGMLLSNSGHDIVLTADGREAWEKFSESAPDLLITDLRMPNMGGMDLIKRVRETDPDLPIIVITAFGSIESAVEAMQAGATDYLTKPFEETRIKLAIEKALATREVMLENRVLRAELRNRFAFDAIVVEDARMLAVLEQARHVAPANATVIVYGESGTGKELVARAIHEASARSRGPFVALNCAAIPDTLLESELFGHEKGSFTGATEAKKGRFEMAHGGTLFLDEIGEMALPLQAKVLRAIESQEFERVGGTRSIQTDVRFVAATNKNLRQRVADGKFRDDLYYRLNVFPLVLPPLRERPDDILPLTEYFLRYFAREIGKKQPRITPEAEEVLTAHRWPGNVRELKNTIERAMILLRGEELTPELLHVEALEGLDALEAATKEYERVGPTLGPSRKSRDEGRGTRDEREKEGGVANEKAEGGRLKAEEKKAGGGLEARGEAEARLSRWHPFRIPEVGFNIEGHEKALIEQAIERAGGNKTGAARMLGLTRATLRYRLEKYAIGKKDDDEGDAPE